MLKDMPRTVAISMLFQEEENEMIIPPLKHTGSCTVLHKLWDLASSLKLHQGKFRLVNRKKFLQRQSLGFGMSCPGWKWSGGVTVPCGV